MLRMCDEALKHQLLQMRGLVQALSARCWEILHRTDIKVEVWLPVLDIREDFKVLADNNFKFGAFCCIDGGGIGSAMACRTAISFFGANYSCYLLPKGHARDVQHSQCHQKLWSFFSVIAFKF